MSNRENDDLVSPGNTATGSGTSMNEQTTNEPTADEPSTEGGLADIGTGDIGTTEADVSDGSEQKQPPLASDRPDLD